MKVVVVGGSVTNGGACASYALPQSKKGAFGTCSWSHRFVQWLQAHHSNPHINLVNLAMPATTSAWRLSHFDEVMSVHPDLLIVDYGTVHTCCLHCATFNALDYLYVNAVCSARQV